MIALRILQTLIVFPFFLTTYILSICCHGLLAGWLIGRDEINDFMPYDRKFTKRSREGGGWAFALTFTKAS